MTFATKTIKTKKTKTASFLMRAWPLKKQNPCCCVELTEGKKGGKSQNETRQTSREDGDGSAIKSEDFRENFFIKPLPVRWWWPGDDLTEDLLSSEAVLIGGCDGGSCSSWSVPEAAAAGPAAITEGKKNAEPPLPLRLLCAPAERSGGDSELGADVEVAVVWLLLTNTSGSLKPPIMLLPPCRCGDFGARLPLLLLSFSRSFCSFFSDFFRLFVSFPPILRLFSASERRLLLSTCFTGEPLVKLLSSFCMSSACELSSLLLRTTVPGCGGCCCGCCCWSCAVWLLLTWTCWLNLSTIESTLPGVVGEVRSGGGGGSGRSSTIDCSVSISWTLLTPPVVAVVVAVAFSTFIILLRWGVYFVERLLLLLLLL